MDKQKINNKLKVALIQMNSTDDYEKNMEKAMAMVQEAIEKNAQFILLPEVFYHRSSSMTKRAETVEGPSITRLRDTARSAGVAILAGSIYESIPDSKKVFNTSVLIDECGDISAVYRKIHLFNVSIAGTRIIESMVFEAGDSPVIGKIFGKQVGMSICYDVRFPELYRQYSEQGGDILVCPASFTKPTGDAHWDVLCRARAIENQAFMLAPNQVGIGAGAVPSFGHSLIVDPWGNVLEQGGLEDECVLMADLDFNLQNEQRKQTPFLTHRRLR